MKTLTLITLLTIATPFAAQADTINLSAPMAGATVHTDDVDMSVYWTTSGDAFEVVAFYLPRGAGAETQKLQMRLEDNDSVTFGLPSFEGVQYSFERTSETLTVTGVPLPIVQASNR